MKSSIIAAILVAGFIATANLSTFFFALYCRDMRPHCYKVGM